MNNEWMIMKNKRKQSDNDYEINNHIDWLIDWLMYDMKQLSKWMN